jgi:membrane protein
MASMHDRVSKVSDFFSTGIWRVDTRTLHGSSAFLIRPLRIIALSVQEFIKDNCALRASALTFYSLLSVVPVMALLFGIAKGFGLEQRLETLLYERLTGQEEVLEKIITFSRSLLENTKGGVVAGIGVILLFWSSIKLMGHIEKALNEIWKVKHRSFIRRFTDYLSIMIISPLLVIVSSSVNVYITTQIKAMAGEMVVVRMVGPFILMMLKLLPFGLIWILFIMLYMVMPNTRVRLTSSVIAGAIAAVVFQLLQGTYISAQVLVARYNAIYGSFAALPLFLMWLQLSWMIVLYGAQIAFAHQHVGHAAMLVDIENTSSQTQKLFAVHILKHIIERFQKGSAPQTAEQISKALRLPNGMAAQLLQHMVDGGMVSMVTNGRQSDFGFQPARDIHGITMADLLSTWDKVGRDPAWPTESDSRLGRIQEKMLRIQEDIGKSQANCLIKDI